MNKIIFVSLVAIFAYLSNCQKNGVDISEEIKDFECFSKHKGVIILRAFESNGHFISF